MRNAAKLSVGLLLSALALGLTLPTATAGFYHSRGILTALNENITIYLSPGSPGYYTHQLVLVIMPPWYFVPDLYKFDTVTLKMRLVTQEGITCCWQARSAPNQPTLVQDTFQWTDVVIGEDGDGGIVGAVQYATVTFVIEFTTRRGFYLLYLEAEATAGDTVFRGFDQVPVNVKMSLSECGLFSCNT